MSDHIVRLAAPAEGKEATELSFTWSPVRPNTGRRRWRPTIDSSNELLRKRTCCSRQAQLKLARLHNSKLIAAFILIVVAFHLYASFLASADAPLYRFNGLPSQGGVNNRLQSAGNPAIIPQNWARGLVPEREDTISSQSMSRGDQNEDLSSSLVNRPQANKPQGNMMKSVRHIVTGSSSSPSSRSNSSSPAEDICADRLCYGLPTNCAGTAPNADANQMAPTCLVLVTSKRFIDPDRPVSRDILFELIALPSPDMSNYAAVGFSETGRMAGLVSECLQYRDQKTQLQIIKLKHSYNVPSSYQNVPVNIISGIKSLGVSYENGYYQCRWIVESAVEFSYEAANGSTVMRREDLGYKNYHILLATGEYNERDDSKCSSHSTYINQ